MATFFFAKGGASVLCEAEISARKLKPYRPAMSTKKFADLIAGTRRPVEPAAILARPAAGRHATLVKPLCREEAHLQSE